MAKKYNSLNDQTAQMMRQNQNVLELLTKIDQAVNSNESYVSVKTVDATGKETVAQIPTVGFFKQKLDQLTKMVKLLAGMDGNPAALQIANNSFKRIIAADLNDEPKSIPELGIVSTFKTDPNWIFDSFLNPRISVELDLTNKIDEDTRTILSRRFIVEFDKVVTVDDNGNEDVVLTTDGDARKLEFEQKYLGKTNIDMVEFVTWLDSPGLVNRVDDTLIDQDYFRIEPNRLQYKGDFTISSTDLDTVNKKLWYILDTLTYYDVSDLTTSPKPIDLKIGDLIKVNPTSADTKSTSVYKVVEISTITSEYRVRFEQVFGEEPIPVRLNAISYYSNTVPKRNVRISVGFDEYCVMFVKQVNDTNNIVGLDWSPGMGIYTNELRLDNETGELFSDYYVSKVYDYGLVLEDLVAKKVPNYYGIKPNAPVLDNTNFKVVQINAHLTQTVEAEKIRDLHNNKNTLVSEISQLQSSIEKKNRQISTTSFESSADKKRADDELVMLQSKLDAKNQSKITVISDIIASKKNLNKIAPVYHLRGFFPMPEAVQSSKTKPQEVVQFEVWYRKLSKSGAENPILTITDLNNSAAQTASPTNTTANASALKPKVVNGTFSNWQKFKTDSRKRVQDPISGEWLWSLEDVSDANTPNINQVDIPILPGERIEIKVKSLSEVGWPETPLESEFSNILTIDFPDDLNNVLNEDEFILKEAQADDIKVQFERDLESRGLTLHLNSAIRDADIYYAHKAESIASGFRDTNGKIINLYDQLLAMVAKITALEENINRAKGILEVYVVNKGNSTKVFSGNNLSYNLNLEDYMQKTKIGLTTAPVDSIARTYKNELILIDDFSLFIKNAAESSNLGLLSYRGYGQPAGKQPSLFAFDGTGPTFDVTGAAPSANTAIQATWIKSNSEFLVNYTGGTYVANTTPIFATQKDNQWIWLQTKDLSGNYIYNSHNSQVVNNYWKYNPASPYTGLTNRATIVHNILVHDKYNVGLFNRPGSQTAIVGPDLPITDITNIYNWQVSENPRSVYLPLPTENQSINGAMGTTVHPVVSGFEDITDTSTQLIRFVKPGDSNGITIPIYIYAKPYTGTGVYTIAGPGTTNQLFIDNDTLNGAGDMPTVDVSFGYYRKDNALNKLVIQIEGNGGDDIVKPGDRLIFDGFVDPLLTGLNNKVVTVLKVSSGTTTDVPDALESGTLAVGEVLLDYNVPGTMSTTPAIEVGTTGLDIVQLHKKYNAKYNATLNTMGITGGGQLNAYNVLGTIGSDQRYVNNYIEIINTSVTPTPAVHNKKLRFYMEEENNIRPFDLQLNFNITQYKPVVLTSLLATSSISG